jgi:uncharacterized LabA/DUF88 family protein
MSQQAAMRTDPVLWPSTPGPPTMVFLDEAYFQLAACRALRVRRSARRLRVEAVRDWLASGPFGSFRPGELARINWYTAEVKPGHPRAIGQRNHLNAIARLDLIQLRLGSLVEIHPDWQQEVRAGLEHAHADVALFEERCDLGTEMREKGVDGRLSIDLATYARAGMVAHAVLIAGDGDFDYPFEVARDAGVRITLLMPDRSSVAGRLRELADRTIDIPTDVLEGLTRTRECPRDRARVRTTVPTPSPAPLSAPQPAGSAPVLSQAAAESPATDGAHNGRPLRVLSGARRRGELKRLPVAPIGPAQRQPSVALPPIGVVPSFEEYLDEERRQAGFTVKASDGTSTHVYLARCPEDPSAVIVCAGEHGDPGSDTRLMTHHPFSGPRAAA